MNKGLLRLLLLAGLLLGLVLIPYVLFGAALEDWSAQLMTGGKAATAAAGIALLALDIVLPIPSSLVATAMGALLGAPLGALVNAVGLTLGCALGFLLGRGGSPLARRLLGAPLQAAFTDWIERYGLAALILCRAVPVLAEASVLALGAGKARPWPVLGAAFAADLCLGAAYAFAGAQHPSSGFVAAILFPVAAAAAVWLILRRRPLPESRG